MYHVLTEFILETNRAKNVACIFVVVNKTINQNLHIKYIKTERPQRKIQKALLLRENKRFL